MKRFILLILCAVWMLSLFSGCQDEDPTYTPTGNGLGGEGEVTVPTTPTDTIQEVTLVYDPSKGLNPYQCTDYTNRVLFPLLYQGLFTVDSNYTVYPILCESYTVSPDMKAYTFYIADAHFSDGTALTADDVAASLNAARESTWYSGRLRHIVSVAGYGEAVLVELDTAMENLPLILDVPIVKATEVDAAAPIGSGPYRFDGDHLRRQAGWWCSASLIVSCDTIRLVEATTISEIQDRFRYEGVSIVCADPSDRNYVDFRGDYELWECENGLFLYLACYSKSTVFQNDAVRAALTHAIDRDTLVENYYLGFARSATLPASPQSPNYISNLAVNYGYAPNQFRSAVESAGLTGSTITLLVNGDDATRVKVAYAIAAMLEEGGLKVTVKESASGAFLSDLKKGKYDLYLAQTRLSTNMDLSAFFGTNTALNYGGLSSPGIYAMSLEALANSGNYYTLYEMIMDDGLLCPILFQSYAIYTRRGVFSQLQPTRDNLFYYDLGRTITDALQ